MSGEIGDRERYRGCLLGLACGDAVGTTLEFGPRRDVVPISDMVGGGPFNLPPGAWTDDCSMALCLAHSLIQHRGFDAADQMDRYCAWAESGYLSSTGTCFDIGNTVRAALQRYRRTGEPFSGMSDPATAGNGALMRLAPIAMFYRNDAEALLRFAADSTRTTHGAPEAIEASRLFATQLRLALSGASRDEALFGTDYHATEERIATLARGDWRHKTVDDVRGTGYVVASLEAALWCFRTTDSFADAILRAANLGDDADTTAAICGQISGAFYGVAGIPGHWVDRLVMRDDITAIADDLLRYRVDANHLPQTEVGGR